MPLALQQSQLKIHIVCEAPNLHCLSPQPERLWKVLIGFSLSHLPPVNWYVPQGDITECLHVPLFFRILDLQGLI